MPVCVCNQLSHAIDTATQRHFKNNSFKGGKFNAQFRAEFFNAFNRVQFSAPATRVDSSNFGVVSGQANSPRQVQLSLKLVF